MSQTRLELPTSCERCSILVVEDSLTALKTAFGAGYNTIGVYDKNTVNDEEENKRFSHLYITSFEELLPLLK